MQKSIYSNNLDANDRIALYTFETLHFMKNLILLYSFTIVLISSLSLFAQNKLDQFQYHYPTSSNQLYYVNDVVPGHVSTIDIDNQSTNNYSYNANGQLTKDEQQNIDTIIWHANGKVKEVHKTTGDVLSFKYDALGNRIVKQLTTNNGQLTTTFYTRNTSSQVIAIYEKQNIDSIKLTELTISGIGNQNETTNHLQNKTNDSVAYRKIGNKNYELKDHLGNIRATITDIKQPSNLFNFFNSTISSTSDYYNYGMQMPGRNYKTENYRYGIQGKEKDNELAGNGNAYDFGARILDPRVGRWLSTDPMADQFPSVSSYNAMGNNPVMMVDPDGKATLWAPLLSGTTYAGQIIEITTSGQIIYHQAEEVLVTSSSSAEVMAARRAGPWGLALYVLVQSEELNPGEANELAQYWINRSTGSQDHQNDPNYGLWVSLPNGGGQLWVQPAKNGDTRKEGSEYWSDQKNAWVNKFFWGNNLLLSAYDSRKRVDGYNVSYTNVFIGVYNYKTKDNAIGISASTENIQGINADVYQRNRGHEALASATGMEMGALIAYTLTVKEDENANRYISVNFLSGSINGVNNGSGRYPSIDRQHEVIEELQELYPDEDFRTQ